jgi:hypothetical protein
VVGLVHLHCDAATRLAPTESQYGFPLTEQERRADADRFGIVQDALAALGTSLERARPSSRVPTLGLG